MKVHRHLYGICLCLALTLTGCATVIKTQKVDPTASQVRDLTIVIRMADLSASPNVFPNEYAAYRDKFKPAFESRFPEVFRVNGVGVVSMVVQDGGIASALAPGKLLGDATSSHVLLINARSLSYMSKYGARHDASLWLEYDAALWDVRRKKLVWKATPGHELDGKDPKPLRRVQLVAATLLKGLNSDGLIKMKQSEALDRTGKEISGIARWEDDY